MSNMAPFTTTTITADPSTNATYTLLSTLGKGGNGTVFLAHDQEGKRVAIKQSNHPDRNNLERERAMLTMLQEEPLAGIPRLLDLTLLDEGQGLVMEYETDPRDAGSPELLIPLANPSASHRIGRKKGDYEARRLKGVSACKNMRACSTIA